MNDISDYIQKELIKIPFNIFNLISKYIEFNKGTKVAFVGGFIRDLLITKFHRKDFLKPVDIDIVIEGSSISFLFLTTPGFCCYFVIAIILSNF